MTATPPFVSHGRFSGTFVKLIPCLCALLLSGCAQKICSLSLNSEPPGALFYQGSRLLGRGQRNLCHIVTPQDKKVGAFTFTDVWAKWPSGTASEKHTVTVPLVGPLRQPLLLERPPGGKGEQYDQQYGLQYARMTFQQQQQLRAAALAEYQQVNAALQQQQMINAYNQRTQVLSQPVNVNYSGVLNVHSY